MLIKEYISDERIDRQSIVLACMVFKPDIAIEHRQQLSADVFDTFIDQAFARVSLKHIDRFGAGAHAWAMFEDVAAGSSDNTIALDRLVSLSEMSKLVHRNNFTAYLRPVLRDRHDVERSLAIEDAARSVADGADLGDHVKSLQDLMHKQERMLGSTLQTLADTLHEDVADEKSVAFPTGDEWFDLTMPGDALQAGDKLVISAPPGAGKTTLALQATVGMLKANQERAALWCMGEMSTKQLRNRTLTMESSLPIELLRHPWEDLSPQQTTAKHSAIDTLRDIGRRLHFLESPLTPAAIERGITSTGATWVVIDYLQLCKPDHPGNTRRDEVDDVVRELTRISQQHQVVLFLISDQAKGAGSNVRRDIFTAFKESSEIAFAADLAFVGEMLTEAEGDDLPDDVSIRWRCLKARNGQPQSMVVNFNRPLQQMTGVMP